MISNSWKGKIILDTISQFQQLVSQGYLIINGNTVTYDPYHYDYWVKESNYYTKSETDAITQIIRDDHPPTTGTRGSLGQCYIDVITDKIYQCTNKNYDENFGIYLYEWIEIINNETVALHCATDQDIDNLFN